ncbi:MAG: LPXTG cell wall anchor domain-containing protein [Eubacteriales bacterium]|nr:LPXTG cell wall anchor domain-containing protein [Eubacteriales bacterium]
MEADTVEKDSQYTLPECAFTAPDGKEFKAWDVAGEEKAVGAVITVSDDTIVKALWKAKTEEPEAEAEEKEEEEESITIWPGSSGTIGFNGLQILPINQSSSPDRTTDYSGSKVTGSANDTGIVSNLPTSGNNVPSRQEVTQLPSTGESGMNYIAATLALAGFGLLIGIRKRMR